MTMSNFVLAMPMDAATIAGTSCPHNICPVLSVRAPGPLKPHTYNQYATYHDANFSFPYHSYVVAYFYMVY